MRAAGFDPAGLPAAAHSPDKVLAFVEVHIEQGPVLLNENLPVGVVTAISGATRFIVEHGREAIQWLIDRGVPFTRDEQAELGYHLTREGGHSHRRIIHAADATGHAVVTTLTEQVRRHPNITILEDHFAIDL
ncbi:FAD-binding protein, partial [Salmonella enterica subsp. enterica]